jgi:hypothetical protein
LDLAASDPKVPRAVANQYRDNAADLRDAAANVQDAPPVACNFGAQG